MTTAQSVRSSAHGRWAILAMLRFVLATIVLFGHAACLVAGPEDWTAIGLKLNQGSAVFGFLILSGYSIAASLDRERAGYCFRRFVRIGPLYLITVIIGAFISFSYPEGLHWPQGYEMPSLTAGSFFASLFMLQNIVAPPVASVGVIWSLAVEWWHYMAAPWLKRAHSATLAAALMTSFLMFLVIDPPKGGGAEGLMNGLGVVTLSWMWLTGFLYHRHEKTLLSWPILALPSLIAYLIGHFTGIPLFLSIVVIGLCRKVDVSHKLVRLFNYLGDLSFPLYLCHLPVMVVFVAMGVEQTLPMVAAAFMTAVALLHFVDYPSRAALVVIRQEWKMRPIIAR